MPERLLTAECSFGIENFFRFIESIYEPLTSNLPNIIKDTSHLLNLIDDVSKSRLPDTLISASFDIFNMFPKIDNERKIEAMRSLLDSRKIHQQNA